MIWASHPLRCFFLLVGVLIGVSVPQRASGACSEGNVLIGAELIESGGIRSPEVLTDGWTTPKGSSPRAREAATFRSSPARLTWELNEPTQIAAVDIQADWDDTYVLLGSLDGSRWWTIWEVPTGDEAGLVARSTRGLADKVRFVRLTARGGDEIYSISELRVYCESPREWPVPALVRLARIERPESTATYRAFAGKIVVALVGLFLVFAVAPRLKDRRRRAIYVAIIGLSALGWTHFGQFQGRTLVHPWDMFHYYTGSKYYGELGYTELYRCIAKVDRERGNEGRYRNILIRNLDDNSLYPFWWTKTDAGRCRAQFSKEAWTAFGDDIETFRSTLTSPPFEHVVGDHGFNATPFHATWLGVITKVTNPTPRTLRVLAQIDSMALLAAVFSLAWGFGLPVAAVAALLIQVGEPWSYNWVGGGLARHVWFALTCYGLACLKQRCPGRGAAALTAATLLRLFPIVFLGGLSLYFVSEWARTRKLSTSGLRALAGCGTALGIGFGLVLALNGPAPLGKFVDKISHHADAPAGNRMGLPHLLSLGPGKMSSDLMDSRLTDPTQPWKEDALITRKERAPLWYLAVLASFGTLHWVVWTVRSAWISSLAAGPLLYSLQDMTSYDYMWLVLLAPLAFRLSRTLKWLCAFAIMTQAVGVGVPDFELRHWIFALALLPLMVLFCWDLVQLGRSSIRARASR